MGSFLNYWDTLIIRVLSSSYYAYGKVSYLRFEAQFTRHMYIGQCNDLPLGVLSDFPWHLPNKGVNTYYGGIYSPMNESDNGTNTCAFEIDQTTGIVNMLGIYCTQDQ